MLTDIQSDRNAGREIEMFGATFPVFGYIGDSLHIYTVFHDVVRPFIAVFTKGQRNRFLGYPDMVEIGRASWRERV